MRKDRKRNKDTKVLFAVKAGRQFGDWCQTPAHEAGSVGPAVNGDEVRNIGLIRFRGRGYDASEVNDLLLRIAAELDAGRSAGPLIANATFQKRSLRSNYKTGPIDWFLEQLRREDPAEMARMNADPWRDLATDPYCIRRQPGDIAGHIAAPSQQEYADAWRDFGQQPGTRLSLVPTGAGRHELRTAEQQTVATAQYRLATTTLNAGGRTLTLEAVTVRSWPGIAGTISRDRPDLPAHALRRQAGEREAWLRQLLDETGTPVLYTGGHHAGLEIGGQHTDRYACGYIKFPGHRWLRFPVRGTRRANAVMTAVDQSGNKVARYRLARKETGLRRRVEITVHPGQQLTDELALALALSAPWLSSYFHTNGWLGSSLFRHQQLPTPGPLTNIEAAEGREHAGGSVGVLPRTRRRSVHDSRNLSRAPSASLVIGFAAP
jgi:hypothetical protein